MLKSDGILDGRTLARTYDGGYYPDAAEIADQYFEVMRYASHHPNKGSHAIASKFDIPRGRVRTWKEGGAPDAARALEVARDYGWLEADYDDREFRGLNVLVANVFSGGSIVESNYRPSFALTSGDNRYLFDALEAVGIDYETVEDRDGRADEARPAEHGTVLGRTLSVLGAPVGRKTQQRLSLPDYLDHAPDEIREQFVMCYLDNRGAEHGDILKLREERNDSYLAALAELIEDAVGGDVTRSEKNIMLSKDATQNLAVLR